MFSTQPFYFRGQLLSQDTEVRRVLSFFNHRSNYGSKKQRCQQKLCA
jgi:hypothetical protein